MSQSISPKGGIFDRASVVNFGESNSRQRSNMISMVGGNNGFGFIHPHHQQYMTPRPVKLVKKILKKHKNQTTNYGSTQRSNFENSLTASDQKIIKTNRNDQGIASSSASKSRSKSKSKRNITMKKISQLAAQQQQFNTMASSGLQKENLNIQIPQNQSIQQQNNGSYQKQMISNHTLQNFLKTQTQPNSTKNATSQHFQPFFENAAVKKLQKIQKNQIQTKNDKTRHSSSKPRIKQRFGETNYADNGFNTTHFKPHLETMIPDIDPNSSSARKIRIQSTLESPSSTKDVTRPFFNPKHLQLQKMINGNFKVNQQQKSNPQGNTTNQQQQFMYINDGVMIIDGKTRKHSDYIQNQNENSQGRQPLQSILQKQRNGSKNSQQSRGNDIDLESNQRRMFQSQHEEMGYATVSQREFFRAAENLKKRSDKTKKFGGNYTLATTSIASAGDLVNSTDRHKLKIKPPKHSFNQINPKQQQFTPQSQQKVNINSPGKNPSQAKIHQQNNYLSSLASKNQYNPSNYLMSAQLLNKQKTNQQSQKSRNGQFIVGSALNSLSSQQSPAWQTQTTHAMPNGFNDLLVGSASAHNLHATMTNIGSQIPTLQHQNKNKSQNQILLNPQSFSNQIDQDFRQVPNTTAQQIQAAVIKNFKYQNNFKLSFTNSFNHQNQGIRVKDDGQENNQQEAQKKVKEQIENFDKQLEEINSPTADSTEKHKQYLKVLSDITNLIDPQFQPLLQKLNNCLTQTHDDLYQHNLNVEKELKLYEQDLVLKQEDFDRLYLEMKDLETNETECRLSIQQLAQQIDDRDDMIERLEYELDNQRRKNRELFKQQMKLPMKKGQNGEMMIQQTLDDEDNYSQQVGNQELINENTELKQIVKEMQEELDYGKQRENKLMFFLFILKEKGFPISEVFEDEIKDIPTTRFSTHFDDEYKQMYFQIRQERKHARKEAKLEKLDGGFGLQRDEIFALSPLTERVFSYVSKAHPSNLPSGLGSGNREFEQIPYIAESDLSDSNFVPVTIEKPIVTKRPNFVPKLDLMSMPHQQSDTSDESDEEDSHGKPKRGPNPRQLKKILDNYNIHTCARNLMHQEKVMRKKKNKKSSMEEIKFNRSYISSIKSSIVLMEPLTIEKSLKKKQARK